MSIIPLLILELMGCRNFNTHCTEKADCEDGNDADIQACEKDLEDEAEKASSSGCKDAFDAWVDCVEHESDCDSNDVYSAGKNCRDEEAEYLNCVRDTLTTVDTDDTDDTPAESFDWSTTQGWVGTQTYTFGNSDQQDDFNCVLHFDTSGARLTPTPAECAGCLWVIDVAFTFNAGLSTDDGTCAALGLDQQTGHQYGVVDSATGDSQLMLKDVYGNYFDFGAIRQTIGPDITFEGGSLNVDIGGTFSTGYWQGAATLSP